MQLSFSARVARDFRKNKRVYLLALPMVAYLLIFRYAPMLGISIAFQDFRYRVGFWGSPFVGLKHFKAFWNGYHTLRVIRNTLIISGLDILFVFPAPIALALLINEVRGSRFKRVVQTVTYMPHFISVIVFCGMILDFLSMDGVLTRMLRALGMPKVNLMMQPSAFRTIYTASSIWKEAGWGAIVYLAAVTRVDTQLYEAAEIDGASRMQKLLNITLPGLVPTIVMLLVLKIGSMMNVGFERIILLYNDVTMETADIISSYVYRKGLIEHNYSFSAAVDLFNSVVNFALVLSANTVSRRLTENSLW